MRIVPEAFPVPAPGEAKLLGHLCYFEPVGSAIAVAVIFDIPDDLMTHFKRIVDREAVIVIGLSATGISNDVSRLRTSLGIEGILFFE